MANTTMVTVTCVNCGRKVERLAGEVARSKRLGRRTFCSRSCSAVEANKARKSQEIDKVCLHCGKKFTTVQNRHEASFCSRSCASAGSVTEYRRQKAKEIGYKNLDNLLTVEECLKRREAWKYEQLVEGLDSRTIDYEFEYELDGFVFDLVLFSKKLLIEFDGKYHAGYKQLKRDEEKDVVARENGYELIRIKTGENVIIPFYCLEGLL